SYGARTLARSVASTIRRVRIAPIITRRLDLSRRNWLNRLRWIPACGSATRLVVRPTVRVADRPSSGIRDSWVQQRVDQVDQQVHHHKSERDDKDRALHNRIVPTVNSIQ